MSTNNSFTIFKILSLKKKILSISYFSIQNDLVNNGFMFFNMLLFRKVILEEFSTIYRNIRLLHIYIDYSFIKVAI